MSNTTLTRPRNPGTAKRAFSNRIPSSPPIPNAVRSAPLCKVAIIVLAVTASSCGLASQENSDAMNGDRLGSACHLQDGSDGPANTIEREILALVNRERRSAGVEPLCFSPGLADAARQHNSKMASEGILDHRI